MGNHGTRPSQDKDRMEKSNFRRAIANKICIVINFRLMMRECLKALPIKVNVKKETTNQIFF